MFCLVYIAPGDPLQTILPEDASEETIAMVKKAYGFDKPIAIQYGIWLGKVPDRRFRYVDRDRPTSDRGAFARLGKHHHVVGWRGNRCV